MYGLVNQAVRDLVIKGFGEEKWNLICKEAGIPNKDFVSMQYYPDTITYSLVGAAAKHLNLSAETILSEFGKHWVLYTAENGYGPLMDLFGENYKSCLMNLNNLHARMGLSMPELAPPRFIFTEITPEIYQIEYQSKRQGLEPMVQGLLEGLAQKYKTPAVVKQIPTQPGKKIFQITIGGK